MVIGNGMVAKRFESYERNNRFVIFASGVSNSKSRDPAAYWREFELLKATTKAHKDKVLVYFSTCSIYDQEEKDSQYVLHKKEIEYFIQEQCRQYYVFRVSNLVGSSNNPNTVLNFFVYHIHNKINFDLWSNTTRNLIDIDDMYKILIYILDNQLFLNEITNIATPLNYSVSEIIMTIEKLFGIEANYIPIPKGKPFLIDISSILFIIEKLDIHFGKDYLINLFQKYYGP